ncbi:shikimate 5-dehydrogenase [Geotalea daltonii FRC-32]|uniref:Shikimate dehydrogenase (NADP(+)) n=1 Tax=Geotalea daltonii (strain DSM 22248 / JCM 15807 / FRC-32) TaxID=316067 RepID=B9M5F9_GEODF|nr:shikimate dehydrogenase [Geotalea daltonii]ACM21718.1 shikimate 5-dehydrogenase [Geotalea daltonii FRC-32]
MKPAISGWTKVLGIIGSPLSHSLSPLMHNAALDALGLDYVYVPFPVSPDRLGEAIQGLKSLGIVGFNVTIPHKSAIIPYLDRLSPEAELAGAVNTVNREGDLLVGYNTDGAGLLVSLKEDLAFEPGGAKVLILGAGGAARGTLAALGNGGAVSITVANRNREKANELIGHFAGVFNKIEFHSISLEVLLSAEHLQRFDLVINTTSVGMNNTSFNGFSGSSIKGVSASFYDMVYAPPITPFLELARLHGCRTANGLGMLAAQGEIAFSHWTGLAPPRGLMKSCLLTAVKGN